MNNNSDKKPSLKLLEEQEPEVEQLAVEPAERVEVLRPDKEARLKAKSFAPDVAEILDSEEEEGDTEDSWGEGVKKAPPMGWFVLLGLVITGLAFWAIIHVFEAQPELEEVVEKQQDIEQKRIEEDKKVKATLMAMEVAIKGFLGAKSIEQLLPHVRHPQRVKPLMEQYYQENAHAPAEYSHLVRARPLGIETESFVHATVSLKDGSQRVLVLQQVEKERFLVDWEVAVQYQPMSWDEFREKRPVTPVLMRLLLLPDNYHTFEFRDEESYDCYKLVVQSGGEHVYGFAPKGTELAQKLKEYVRLNQLTIESDNPQPLMLKISFPEKTRSKKCVLINEFVEPRWLFIEAPQEQD